MLRKRSAEILWDPGGENGHHFIPLFPHFGATHVLAHMRGPEILLCNSKAIFWRALAHRGQALWTRNLRHRIRKAHLHVTVVLSLWPASHGVR